MKQRNVITAAIAAAGLVVVTGASVVSAPAAEATAAQAAQAAQGPAIKLIAAQHTITAQRFGKQVFVDPGIWVASLGAPLQLDVGRASYTDPVTITQVITQPGLAPQIRPLPASVLDGWNALKNFISLTIKNKERGWAVDAAQSGRTYRLALGTYRVTESITAAYTRLFGIPPAHATATVVMKVVKGTGCCAAVGGTNRQPAAHAKLSAVAAMTNPPESALPDLVPLPAGGIRTTHAAGHDLLNFAATVWVGGNGQLDVQGFRVKSSPVMSAYQYFWQDGQVIGRARVGTMGFDSAARPQSLALRAVRRL